MTDLVMSAVPSDDARLSSDPALLARTRQRDVQAIEELVARHGLAMTRFEQIVGLAVTRDPAERIARLVDLEHLPLRAAWLTDRAHGFVHDEDDVFLLARFTELTTAWRTALWHAEVEGDSPAAIGRLLGMGAAEATMTVRTARVRLMWSIVDGTPAGTRQDCIDTAARLCNAGADSREILALAAEHGRHCDDCMLLVKRALRFASSLRDCLLRPLAGDLASSYGAARPPAFRPGPRVDLVALVAQRGRPAVVTAAMGIGAAAAIAAMAVGPGAVPAYLKPQRDVSASLLEGQQLTLRSRPQASPAVLSNGGEARFAPADLSVTLPDDVPGGKGGAPKDGSKGETDQSLVGSEPEVPEDSDPGSDGSEGPLPGGDGAGDPDTPADTGKPTGPVVPSVHVEAGPVTVDTSGDEPLVSIDGPLPVEVPPVSDADLDDATDAAGGIVTGLLG